jgi:diguanylate cyclase (GGDEF)-like protein
MLNSRSADNDCGVRIGCRAAYLEKEIAAMGSFKLKLVLYFALIALLPTVVAFYGFDALAKQNETRRADARLQSGLLESFSAYNARLDAAESIAADAAADTDLQQGLRERDRAAVAKALRRFPNVVVRARGFEVGSGAAVAGERSVSVRDGGRSLGRVVARVPIDEALLRSIRMGLGDHDLLIATSAGRIVAGADESKRILIAPGSPERVSVGDSSYRGIASAALTNPEGLTFAALAPQSEIDAAAADTDRRLFLGLLGALVLFGFVTYLLGRSTVGALARVAAAANAIASGNLHQRVDVKGRDEFAQLGTSFNRMADELEQRLVELEAERKRLRDSTLRFGEALEATHDIDQLLRVIVETAVEASGAYGGLLLDRGREVVRVGDPEAGLQRIAFPLRSGQSDFGSVIVSAPEFNQEQVEIAASLAANAAIALENARLHGIVERQALVDPLTEIANRRALDETLEAELARAARFRDDMCLVLADLDRFKSINDRFGHPLGDVVLREFAQTLKETVREVDFVGRWGGEEFALILPGTDAAGGAAVADRARATIAARVLHAPHGELIPVTASFGVAAFPDTGDAAALIAAADEALYRAKHGGRNRVVTAAQSVSR